MSEHGDLSLHLRRATTIDDSEKLQAWLDGLSVVPGHEEDNDWTRVDWDDEDCSFSPSQMPPIQMNSEAEVSLVNTIPSQLAPTDPPPYPAIREITEDVLFSLGYHTPPVSRSVTAWLESADIPSATPEILYTDDNPPPVPPKDFPRKPARPVSGAISFPPGPVMLAHSPRTRPVSTPPPSKLVPAKSSTETRIQSRQGHLQVLASDGTSLGYVPKAISAIPPGSLTKDTSEALLVELPSYRSLATYSWGMKAINWESIDKELTYVGLSESPEGRWRITACSAEAGDVGYVQGLLDFMGVGEPKSKVWTMKTHDDDKEELCAAWDQKTSVYNHDS
ncbi:hypothetical protein FRB96_002116 [Tulasnella sp. 330]|nr:hypothetical protein FRB96_002116 [Tulasnella sp. 330]